MPHTEFNKSFLSTVTQKVSFAVCIGTTEPHGGNCLQVKTVTLLHWMDFYLSSRKKKSDGLVCSFSSCCRCSFCHFVLLGNGHRENQISPLSSTTVDVRRDRFTARRAQKDYPRGEKGIMSEASKYHPEAGRFVRERFGDYSQLHSVLYMVAPKPGEFAQIWHGGHSMKPGDSFQVMITGVFHTEESLREVVWEKFQASLRTRFYSYFAPVEDVSEEDPEYFEEEES